MDGRAELRDDLGLPMKALQHVVRGAVTEVFDHLYRDGPTEKLVSGEVDLAHPARSNLVAKLVVSEVIFAMIGHLACLQSVPAHVRLAGGRV